MRVSNYQRNGSSFQLDYRLTPSHIPAQSDSHHVLLNTAVINWSISRFIASLLHSLLRKQNALRNLLASDAEHRAWEVAFNMQERVAQLPALGILWESVINLRLVYHRTFMPLPTVKIDGKGSQLWFLEGKKIGRWFGGCWWRLIIADQNFFWAKRRDEFLIVCFDDWPFHIKIVYTKYTFNSQ